MSVREHTLHGYQAPNLRRIAKNLGIKGISRMTRRQLIEKILRAEQEEEN